MKKNLAMKRYKVVYIMDNFLLIKDMARVNFFGIMVNIIKENGKMGISTEVDYGKLKKGIAI